MMEKQLHSNLLACAKAYGDSAGLSVSTVAKKFVGDSRFFDKEGSFTVRTYDRLIARFSLEWPKDIPWPENVTRPSKSAALAAAEA